MVICNKCKKKNPDKTKFCMGCGNDLKSKVKTDFDKEESKNQIAPDMADYRAWIGDIISEINEGGLPQSEVTHNLKEAKSRTNDLIKELEGGLKAIDDMIKKSAQVSNSFACPYCKKEINVKNGVQDKEMEIKCELCHKNFKCITGIVSVTRGRMDAAIQYGPQQISITLKLKNGTTTVNFRTHYQFLVNRGDKISFIYMKKFLSSAYKEKPSFIYNWSAEEVYIV